MKLEDEARKWVDFCQCITQIIVIKAIIIAYGWKQTFTNRKLYKCRLFVSPVALVWKNFSWRDLFIKIAVRKKNGNIKYNIKYNIINGNS